ncbi:helix-turn-helix domain-containing protein [Alkaliphilus oremlandii]|uniref:Transcriptional regulator, XRE family n=1 Tax=Alkaliphilus oremlandii (strain OhILAs) TaxID=350688 RepID=A8ML18_ALKOO|nr:helix-turn-helix transcriptional regulator [Alkaliphilus oremlandii]ABW17835.1 transcriptional regulator, XRE family [Alkaliphilus oremlandii OhILAs]
MLNGLKVRELRNIKGYTTLDISNLTHISKSYIEELERGAKKNPSLNKVVVLAKVLGVKVDELILN